MSRITIFNHHVILPYFLSTSMTSLIFIHCGNIYRKINGLAPSKNDILFLILTVSLFIFIQLYYGPNDINMMWNKYSSPYIPTVLGGVSGSLSIIYICKYIKYIPIISYIGRYSLIVLSTHILLIPLIKNISTNPYINLFILIIFSCPIIYLFKTYFPKYCAQAPLIKI